MTKYTQIFESPLRNEFTTARSSRQNNTESVHFVITNFPLFIFWELVDPMPSKSN